jgi:hypothetical protein
MHVMSACDIVASGKNFPQRNMIGGVKLTRAVASTQHLVYNFFLLLSCCVVIR